MHIFSGAFKEKLVLREVLKNVEAGQALTGFCPENLKTGMLISMLFPVTCFHYQVLRGGDFHIPELVWVCDKNPKGSWDA